MALFLYSEWLKLPLQTRIKIAKEFGIAKVRATHVADNRIVDDGYNIHEIEQHMTVEALQAFLGSSEEDPSALMSMLVSRVEEPAQPAKMAQLPKEEAEKAKMEYEERTGMKAPIVEDAPKKRGRKPKSA